MKIENVIDSCSDCRYCHQMVECNGNTFFACICDFGLFKKDMNKPHPFTVVATGTERILGMQEIPIPNNCPLEDYKK